MSIPKIIHYCWFGGKPLPSSAKKCIRSWERKCPDYKIMRWDESNTDVRTIAYVKEAYDEQAYAFVSDYARMVAVYEYGGIYLDTDVELLRSLDSLLRHWGFAGREGKDYVAFGLGFGAEKGHPLVLAHKELYESITFSNHNETENKVTLPILTTGLLKELGFDPEDEEIQNIGGFTIYPTEFFCPMEWQTGIMRWKTKNTYSIHHYDASWFSDDEQQQKLEHWEQCRKEHKKEKRNEFIKGAVGEDRYEWLYTVKEKLKKFGHLGE